MAKRQGIMLGYGFTEKLFERLGSPLIVQPKLEGDRLRGVINLGMPTLYSSSAAERISLPHISSELFQSKFNTIELDGEAYVHGWKHSEIRSIVSRTKNLHPNHEAMQYHVYDVASGYHRQIDRLRWLWDTLATNPMEYVKPVPFDVVYDLDQVQELYDKWLAAGYEGIIMRSMEAYYKRSKTVTMLKLKPRLSDHFEIISVIEEKTIDGIPKGTFGAFSCCTHDNQVFSVGSGPTKVQRDRIWNIRKLLEGDTVKIRFQNYTSARNVPKMQSIDKEWLNTLMMRKH